MITNVLGGEMKQITKNEAIEALNAFKSGRKTFIPGSPKALYLGMQQTWLNREKDDD